MSEFVGGSFEDATWPLGDPVVIPRDFYPSDFTCRPNAGATRLPGTEDYVELGRPQLRAIDSRLLNTPEVVTPDSLELEAWKKFSQLSEKIDFTEGLDETVLSRLFIIAEHVRPIIQQTGHNNKQPQSRRSWQQEMFDDIMQRTDWLQEIIENPQFDLAITDALVNFVGNMKPAKKREINVVRLAATIWYTKMNNSEFTMALLDSHTMFSRLLAGEVLTAAAKIDHAKRPEQAFDVKQRAIGQLSPYAFAGIPMLSEQVDVIASLCSD